MPDPPDALHLLGLADCRLGRIDEGVQRIRRATDLQPGRASMHLNLGRVLDEAELLEEALQAYERAVALRPAFPEALAGLANVQRKRGRTAEAMQAFHRSFLIRRGASRPGGSLDRPIRTTRGKLLHDAEQLEHLAARGKLPTAHQGAPTAYRRLLAELGGEPDARSIDRAERSPVGVHRRQPRPRRPPGPRAAPRGPRRAPRPGRRGDHPGLPGPRPGITHIDGLPTDPSLAALRRYCLDSTFWFDCSYSGGYPGAYLEGRTGPCSSTRTCSTGRTPSASGPATGTGAST